MPIKMQLSKCVYLNIYDTQLFAYAIKIHLSKFAYKM